MKLARAKLRGWRWRLDTPEMLPIRLVLASCCAILFALVSTALIAAEVIPPPPQLYFNDYAHVVSSTTAARLNSELEQFERDTSSQILVVVFPKMQSDSSIEDYTVRVAQSWRVGQKAKSNGLVLFVFIQDRKMFIQVGYGLEGAVPDATAKQIIDEQIRPRFRAGDYEGGLIAGVSALIQAARGEYKGTGRTVADQNHGEQKVPWPLLLIFLFFPLLILSRIRRAMRGTMYGPGGHGSWSGGGWWVGGGGGPWGGGFGGGGGGGGFSGGGGSFGGGGAGGSW